MKPITQEMLREIVPDFAQAIREKKTKTPKPAFAVINFRDEKSQNHERRIESVTISNGRLVVDDPSRLLTGRHHSQMAVWGFRYEPNTNSYVARADEIYTLLQKITKYFSRYQISLELSQDVELAQAEVQQSQAELSTALETGALFKSGATESFNVRDFTDFLISRIPRRLKEHQLKAAVLTVAQFARIRWILTGTPFPHSYVDAFNYFEILWPRCSPISQHDRIRITNYIQKKKDVDAAHLLNSCIGPLFYRVRKRDLGLDYSGYVGRKRMVSFVRISPSVRVRAPHQSGQSA